VRFSGEPLARSEVVANARVASSHDGIVIVPRRGKDGLELAAQIETSMPGIRMKASHARVTISGADCGQLARLTGLLWEESALAYVQNRASAPHAHQCVRAAVADIERGGHQRATELLNDVPGLDVLDDHQWKAVAVMTAPGGYGLCLFDEQGTGKTVTLIHAFDVLVARHEAEILLVIAPKSMVPEWVRDFGRFKRGIYTVRTLAGTLKQKRQQLATGGDVYITNYETAVNMETELGLLLKRHGRRAVLTVDESYNVKSPDAERTQALRRLREWCGRAYVLCGTPAPNSAHDIVEQVSLVDFGSTFGAVTIPSDRTAAKPVIQAALRDRGAYIRHLKVDVLPWLPKKQFHRVTVPMQPVQQRIYSQALEGLLRDLRTTDDVTFRRSYTSYLARRSALLQACSNPRGIAKGYDEVPAKLLVLDRLIEDAVEVRGEKMVIWSAYRASIDGIVDRYSRFGLVRYDGTLTGIDERREAVRRFQDDGPTKLFVGNPAAAGAGLTLHAAHITVYESLSAQAAHYLQSIDRVHRRGQQYQVEYFVLLCDGSMEINEYNRLVAKEAAAQDLLGDTVEGLVTRETFIAELEQAAGLLEGP
jgi:SNF2 family DNA or RNA helicase